MKISFMLLAIITLSLNLFSMELEHKNITPDIKKTQRTKLDKLKTRCALLSCLFFTYAALLNPQAKAMDKRYGKENIPFNAEILPYIPSFIAYIPSRIIHNLFAEFCNKKFSLSGSYNFSTAYSIVIAAISGLYAYKKLSQQEKANPIAS